MERLDQVVTAGVGEFGAILSDDAEVLEQLLEKVVAFEERVVDDGKECLAPELLQHRPAQERFAGADLAGDDDQRLAAIERMAEL